MYLIDSDIVNWLIKCKSHLSNHGLVIVKENLYEDEDEQICVI